MSLNVSSESQRKKEMHEKLAHSERVWHFRKFPELKMDDIDFELTPESKKLFERGKPYQGYLGIGELMPDGKIKLHLRPAFDIKKSADPEVKNIGDRPELMHEPIKPEDLKEQDDDNFLEEYDRIEEWEKKQIAWQAYLKKDEEWMAKWNSWVKKPENFVDKDGVPYATKEYVEIGDANVRGNNGIGHKRMIKRLGLYKKGGVQSELIGFGIWKGEVKILDEYRERSLSQNAYSVLWHDKFFKQYVFNGMEFYGVANRSILKDLIDKMKLPAFIICASPPRKYIIDQNKQIVDCGSEMDYRIISRLELHEKRLANDEKNKLISYEKFTHLKTMVDLSDKSLKELAHPPFVKRNKQEESIKKEVLFYRARSLPWALSEKILATLLENLPDTPYTEGGKRLYREVDKQERRSVLMTSPIFEAAKNGELEEVQKWIEAGGSPNEIGCTNDVYDDFGNSPKNGLSLIEIALKYRQINIFQYLFQHPKYDKGKYFLKMLLKAVEEDFTEALAYLLKMPLLPYQDPFLQIALRMAARDGKVEAVKLLLQRQANPSIKGNAGYTTFHVAVDSGQLKVLEALFQSIEDHGAAANAVTANKDTLLHLAVRGEISIVEFLLAHGADVNAVNNPKNTPLHVAIEYGQRDIVELLLKQGADLGATNSDGRTALHSAAMSAQIDVIDLLVHHGANLNAMDKQQKTALHLAAAEGHYNTVLALINHKVDVSAVDGNQQTALHCAARNGKRFVVKLLLDVDSRLARATDRYKQTPLHFAVYFECGVETVQLLIKHTSDINAANNNGYTPLHLAFISEQMKVAEILLESKADIAAVDKNGSTVLHLAVMDGKIDDVAKHLALRAPELIAIKDKEGRTPLDLATDPGLIKVLKLMQPTQNQAILRFSSWEKPGEKDEVKGEESLRYNSMNRL